MARLAQAPITPGAKFYITSQDALKDLNSLLGRLQNNILHANAQREKSLLTSEYERNKVRANLDYARQCLTKLEQDAMNIKVQSRRQETQADLNSKREALEQVAERFGEIEAISMDSDEDSSEGEDLLGDIIDTPSESVESASAADQQGEEEEAREESGEEQGSDEAESEADGSSPPPASRITYRRRGTGTSTKQPTSTEPAPQETAGTTTSQTLRPRAGASQPAATNTAETTAVRTQLFGNRTTSISGTSPSGATATAEAIMDNQREEQDKLTESMVSMARALKESTNRFQSALQEDQDVLQSASGGIERNERGLQGMMGRMGALRRLTEGKGWWGRIMLYAWIAGLAVFAILLVFVLPKLRF